MRQGAIRHCFAALVAACVLAPMPGLAAAAKPALVAVKNTPDLSETKSFNDISSASFRMAASLLYSGDNSASASWKFAPWGTLNLNSAMPERNEFGAAPQFATLPSSGAVQAAVKFNLGGGWVTSFSYSQSISQLNLRAGALASDADALKGSMVGVSIAKQGLFGQSDALGVGVSQPVQSFSGGALLGPSPKVNLVRALSGQDSWSPANARETDVELGYVTTFLDGALALQANAGYQMNAQGEKGTNSISVLSRAKINF